ncbi:MAG: NADH:ubiquinone reductase (Na(+)-transporting) subunit C [Flavobacteriales bacterium]|nr:NADH:ubiquinone reductase (Na(+)-transporting) subunit C [Flavobacteriales bacterium]
MSKFNKNSNGYILTYAIIMTVVFGILLAFVSLVLKPNQDFNRLLEKRDFILRAALGEKALEGIEKQEISELYEKTVKVEVVNSKGEKMDVDESKISIFKEYKKPVAERELPVYIVYNKTDNSKIESYVFPLYGNGLWDNIWGYLAVAGDLETVKGVVFDHKGETPGLGARITEPAVQARFVGKKIVNASGQIEAPHFQKGEGNNYDNQPLKVDGMSGATITGKGVNSMLDSYLELYKPFIEAKKR